MTPSPAAVVDDASALRRLRRQAAGVAAVWAAVWLLFYLWLRPQCVHSERWLILSALVLGYGLRVLWRGLPANRRAPHGPLLPTLGPGNLLSLVRGLCIGLLAGFLFGAWPMGALAWVLVILYTVTDIADYFDGYLARRADHVTPLGGVLDMEFDGLGTLVVILLAVSFGQLPWWYLFLGLARYLFVFGLWLRRRMRLPVYDMTPSIHRRIFAGCQMAFLSVVLWPILPREMAVIAGTLFAAATATSFLRDWLVVSGVIDPGAPLYERAQRNVYRLFAVWLPPVWRVTLVLCMAAILQAAEPLWSPRAWQGLIETWRLPWSGAFAALISLIAVAGTLMVAFGWLGRVAAVALTLPVGFDIATRGLRLDNGLALISLVFLQLMGIGPFALSRRDETFLIRRLGER